MLIIMFLDIYKKTIIFYFNNIHISVFGNKSKSYTYIYVNITTIKSKLFIVTKITR